MDATTYREFRVTLFVDGELWDVIAASDCCSVWKLGAQLAIHYAGDGGVVSIQGGTMSYDKYGNQKWEG